MLISFAVRGSCEIMTGAGRWIRSDAAAPQVLFLRLARQETRPLLLWLAVLGAAATWSLGRQQL
jgi:hypothetical protein